MCLALYVGADRLLDGGQEGVRLLRVGGEQRVQDRLGKAEVYEIRTGEGCGCGFIADEVPPGPEVQGNRAALMGLLEQLLLQLDGELDLFACWISNESLPVEERTVTPEMLAEESFGETPGRPLLLKIRR